MNILLILLLSTGARRQFYVAPGGSNSADGTALHPWATIQHAADAVAPGDTVHVAPGNYNAPVSIRTSGTAGARITFLSDTPWGAKIAVTGGDVWDISGDYVTVQGFDISSPDPSSSNTTLVGIGIMGSYDWVTGNHVHDIPAPTAAIDGSGGAGIGCGLNWNSTGNVISGNVVNGIGPPGRSTLVHGIYLEDSHCLCCNNICYNNAGVGITSWHAATYMTISNNLCFNNRNGGIEVGIGDSPGNQVQDYCVITNNICIYNLNAYGIYQDSDTSTGDSTGPHSTFDNNLVFGNSYPGISLQTGASYSGPYGGHNTLTVDPTRYFVNWKLDGSGDYHLVSGSPCIGAGTSLGAPAADYDGVSRPQGAGVDIGPYEYGSAATTPPTVTSELQPSSPLANTNATIWGGTATPANPAATDSSAVELGVKFRSDVNGSITGIRFYKGSGNTGTHVGHLWTSTGTLLATATFSNETASGWQQVNFATPMAITAGTTYVASYYAPAGHYAYDTNYFASSGVDSGVLHALSNSAGGGDGVYIYGSGGGFPTNTYEASNYWVDVVWRAGG